MRMLMKLVLTAPDRSSAWDAGQNERLSRVLKSTLETIEPEATYFIVSGRVCTAMLVFELDDYARVPELIGPLCETAGAEVELSPVTTVQDLRSALGPELRPPSALLVN